MVIYDTGNIIMNGNTTTGQTVTQIQYYIFDCYYKSHYIFESLFITVSYTSS